MLIPHTHQVNRRAVGRATATCSQFQQQGLHNYVSDGREGCGCAVLKLASLPKLAWCVYVL